MANKTSVIIAKKLNIKPSELQKKSLKVFFERELLNLKTELLSLAMKYGLKDVKSFEGAVKKGKIHETSETREDFFRLDYLEKRIEIINDFLKSI